MKGPGFIDKLSPLGPVKAWLKKHKWVRRLLYVTPVLLVLALIGPVLGAVNKLLGLVMTVVSPLFETSVGRVVLVTLLVVGAIAVVYFFFKDRVLDAFRRYALSLHLRALEARLAGRVAEAERLFRSVLRCGRFFDLQKGLASTHGPLDVAARLELARAALLRGEAKRARRELALVTRKDLSKRQTLCLAELEARIHTMTSTGIAETVIRKLREAHEAWPAHPDIALLLAGRIEQSGDAEAAAGVLRESLRKVTKLRAHEITHALAALELRRSERAILTGDYALAQRLVDRALRLEESEAGLLRKADLLLAKADLDGALRVLADVGTPQAKARARALLLADDVPLDARMLLERIPSRASLLTLAEHFYTRSDLGRARRTLEVLLRGMEAPSPRALALLASIEMEEGHEDLARETLGRALQGRTRALREGQTSVKYNSTGRATARRKVADGQVDEDQDLH